MQAKKPEKPPKAEKVIEKEMEDKPIEFDEAPKEFQEQPFWVRNEEQGYLL